MPRRTVSFALWLALACWAGGILWLSSMTPKELPEAAFLFSDKFNHFVAFAVGGWLAASALRVSQPQSPMAGRIVVAIILVAAFGAFASLLAGFLASAPAFEAGATLPARPLTLAMVEGGAIARTFTIAMACSRVMAAGSSPLGMLALTAPCFR
jgi:hypothetical protein